MADIHWITDFSAPELDIYARLSEGQLLQESLLQKVPRSLSGPWTQAMNQFPFSQIQSVWRGRRRIF